ncbi:MipA/OmpV family protein [Luteimonas sp. FCS-9]|uniref:MipA/OmpV family protein n=1 Tax=Luteimonas sp. FCS-9 TaxID=1547516 RepID=UPI00063EAFB7|nr:MipA/OmpV family protein [Luteimonas sp. FCS-9]KLJ00383.1 hypothetical protein WQ56_10035 [Luteimonas sp. FCS-9]
MRPACLLLLLATPSLALAQQTTDRVGAEVDTRSDRWTLGIGASVRDSPYAGEGTRVRPFPLVAFQGERFFWRGLTGGAHLWTSRGFTLDALVSGRFDGFDIDDLGRAELAANGLDASRLEDRDDAVDAGLAAEWKGRAGGLRVRALADVTGTSDGYELSADYGYPLQLGSTTLVPGFGVRWMSDDLVNYYYGTLDTEVARGARAYAPGASVVPQLNLDVVHPLTRHWRLFGALEYQFLPDEIADSPFIEPDTDGTVRLMLGISRSF